MKRFRFDNGNEIPGLGLGTWKSKPNEVYEAVKEAIRIGYRHIDCAHIYGNEDEVGRALAESFSEGLVRRSDMWVTSKLWNDAHAPDEVRPALETTLQNLGLDYLDLYLMHWPIVHRRGVMFARASDELIALSDLPVETTWAAMEELVDDGLTRHIGVSNFSMKKLEALVDTARRKPEMNQIELHPYLQQNDMLAFCRQRRILVTAYSPLGSKDRPAALRQEDEPVLLEDPVVLRIAEARGVSAGQVLVAWALHRDTVVIPKSVNPGRMKQNLLAAEITLEAEDIDALAALDRHRRYVDGSIWAFEGSPYRLDSLWDE